MNKGDFTSAFLLFKVYGKDNKTERIK